MVNVDKLPRVGVYLYLMCFMGRANEPLGPLKIGITGNVKSRLASIQTGCHKRVEVLAAFNTRDQDTARRFEATMHQIFSGKRLEGEWFDVDPIDALEGACRVLKDILDESDSFNRAIGATDVTDTMGRVGITHFETIAESLREWRAKYASTSNVTTLGK